MQLDTKMVYLLLGSNLGNREDLIQQALEEIKNKIGFLHCKSAFYETEAWGKKNQPAFLNLAVAVQTKLSPLNILKKALGIEKELGRVRQEKWGSRLIDIDIIFYDNQVININDKLIIPHPEMQHRRFVLEPLSEIAGDVIHPVLNRTVKKILLDLKDNLKVSKI